MKRLERSLSLALILGAVACSMMRTSPTLQSFDGKRFTVCCENHPEKLTNCGRDAWIEVIKNHCHGGAKALSGSIGEKPIGVHMEASEPMYPGDTQTLDVSSQESTRQCVNYECSVNVSP